MGSYQARQKTRKKESVTERRGTRKEKLWRTESIGEEFADFTAIQELSSTCARSIFCQRARAARAYKGGVRKGQRYKEREAEHRQYTEKQAWEGRYPHMVRGEAESEKQRKPEVKGAKEAANPSH